ncbi:MAG: hemolysin family protein [Anaerolineae bacterium]
MNNLFLELGIILLLILFNGIFSMSETAIVSARKARLQQMADEGSSSARDALGLANNPNRFLATVQIGITLIGILTGVFGGATITRELAALLSAIPALAPYSTVIAGLVVVTLLTYFTLIIGELAPKRLALNNAERVASTVAGPMSLLSLLTWPIVRLLGVSTDLVLRLLRVKPSDEPLVTAEEIMVMVGQGADIGLFERSEQDLIERVLALDERRVDSFMTPRGKIVALDIAATIDEVRRKLLDSQHSRFPVVDGNLDNVLGVVRAKDILTQNLAGQSFDLGSLLRPALFLPEITTALQALERFKQAGTHVALVLDEYGGIQGMITHNDVLEAIVGYDPSQDTPAEPQVVRRADGSWLVDGLTAIEDFEDALHLDTLREDAGRRYQTVGGLVMSEVGGVPSTGQSFTWRGLRFEVVDMDGRRVDKVLVAALNSAPSDN